ncbi:MAG TPA: SH3 domain-containing protein, partial [Aggregatilineales bacterium]|nr:SH3 domain-containing protein [Aggregatilineales bacterium]
TSVITGMLLMLAVAGLSVAFAQEPTATPLPVRLPSLTPTSTPRQAAQPSVQPTTATPGWAVEARSQDGGANIREYPSTDSSILTKVYPGQFFPVLSRYGKWLQIQYNGIDRGYAWVFEDVVKLSGPSNRAPIPTSKPDVIATPNPLVYGITLTANYLTLTPGAPETATAVQGSATGVFGPNTTTVTPGSGSPLPTFTDPPILVEATLPVRAGVAASQSGLPPIVPIIALAIIGLMGLLISGLRRL